MPLACCLEGVQEGRSVGGVKIKLRKGRSVKVGGEKEINKLMWERNVNREKNRKIYGKVYNMQA